MLRNWILAWIDIFAGLVTVGSLGVITPDWSFRYLARCTIKDMKKKLDKA
jgi:hypothetical protein